MQKLSKVTDSELEVLKVLWGVDRELSMAQIRTILQDTKKWDSSTIKTLIRRLCTKEIVEAIKEEVYYYRALITQKQYNKYSTNSLINKLFAGSAKSLIASLVDDNSLSDDDIMELKDLFEVSDDE